MKGEVSLARWGNWFKQAKLCQLWQARVCVPGLSVHPAPQFSIILTDLM